MLLPADGPEEPRRELPHHARHVSAERLRGRLDSQQPRAHSSASRHSWPAAARSPGRSGASSPKSARPPSAQAASNCSSRSRDEPAAAD
eukprot:8013199-Heterocapsa_arctica.AAC.1